MTVNRLPPEAWRREVLLVLKDVEVEDLKHSGDGADLLYGDRVRVLTPDFPPGHPILDRLRNAGLTTGNEALVQSPFETDRYLALSEAADRLPIEKHMLFVSVCALLGATRVHLERAESRHFVVNKSVKGDVSWVGSKSDLKADWSNDDRLQKTVAVEQLFSGGAPDVDAADALASFHHLDEDPTIRGLLNLARIPSNRLREQRVTVDLSTETTRRLRVAAGLRLPNQLSIKGSFERHVRESLEYRATVTVQFAAA